MRSLARSLRRIVRSDEAGVTLAEVLISASLLLVGMVAVLSAMTLGLGGVDSGRRTSAAVFLAEQRMEEIRSVAVSPAPGQGFAAVTPAAFPADNYNTMPGYGEFRRLVAITDAPGGVANIKRVHVQVFYRPISDGRFGSETSVAVETVLALR
jgi:hypothetical protein